MPGEMGSIRPIFLKFWESNELLRHLLNVFSGLVHEDRDDVSTDTRYESESARLCRG